MKVQITSSDDTMIESELTNYSITINTENIIVELNLANGESKDYSITSDIRNQDNIFVTAMNLIEKFRSVSLNEVPILKFREDSQRCYLHIGDIDVESAYQFSATGF
ncbi:MAG: hypothetical protein PHY47_18750 [Lachnospiraceae bacterium]|nr:hypothetical protein [Lachnospiraceae bacterium]